MKISLEIDLKSFALVICDDDAVEPETQQSEVFSKVGFQPNDVIEEDEED